MSDPRRQAAKDAAYEARKRAAAEAGAAAEADEVEAKRRAAADPDVEQMSASQV